MYCIPISDQTVGSPLQKSVYMSVNIGDNLSLECPHKSNVFKYYWFKQSLGEIPRLVSVIYRGAYDRVLEDELKNDTRFKLIIDENKNNLDISNVQLSDSATYFCTMSFSMTFKFVQSITVFVKDAQFNINAAIQQSPHEDIESGHSVILNCSFQLERCAGPHKVHWFKQSEESIPGILYSLGGSSSDQCESKKDSPTKSCIYNLPIHNVSSEQTGTYYCAVAACGQVLFGNGTKLSTEAAPVSVYILSGALIFTSSLLIGTFCFCIKNSSGPNTQTSVSSKKTKGFPKVFKYMAAKQVAEEGRRQIDGTWSECIYFSVEMGFK
ncbi:uncharacterized protein [Eucyclogobius newberryi]|uniref:uncharacterized protein n=1 Tax=Eucyclogobius newberryi TaxID=166745 RepID=UPI003B5C97B6